MHDDQRVAAWMTAQPHTIGDDQTLGAARRRMRQLGVRHLPVLHGGQLVGVLSSRDIELVESIPGVDLERLPVNEGMSEDPWTVSADKALSEVARTMAEQKLGTAIVVDDAGAVTGVFTTIDALRALAHWST
jgi:acetoin utilization protein AcuB